MVVSETEVIANREIESTMQTADQQQPKHNAAVPGAAAATAGEGHTFSSLGRQASIYTLTLDEFQHALCESGKNFGSMNMDEFLVSIWNAEENQQAAANSHVASVNGNNAAAFAAAAAAGQVEGGVGDSTDGAIARQTSLPRQGSLTLPPPLCRKTVDEVWLEIHRGQLGNNGDCDNGNSNNNAQNAENAPRQPTFGEMTLEDFLIKAGVVREQHPPHLKPLTVMPPVAQQPQLQSHYGVFQGTNGPSFAPQSVTVGDARTGVYPQVPPTQPAVCYSGRVPNGGGNGGYSGPVQPFGVVGPLSPVSPDGLGHGQVDSEGGQFGIDMGGLRGRKRIVDGPVEKAVERRQRRMIKNRESAARSRARKQAYTVELEAELNQLKEENSQLKQTLAELERKRKQRVGVETQHFEDMKTKPQSKAQKAKEKLRRMRRNNSCPL